MVRIFKCCLQPLHSLKNFNLFVMVYLKTVIFVVLFSSQVFTLLGQNNCIFKIDTLNIQTNQNLDNFLYKLRFDPFEYSTKKNNMPLFIKEALNCLTNDTFSLANPNEDFRCCCTSSQSLPKRQLIFSAKSKNVFALVYLTGGILEQTHILLINYFDNVISDMWLSIASKPLKNLKE